LGWVRCLACLIDNHPNNCGTCQMEPIFQESGSTPCWNTGSQIYHPTSWTTGRFDSLPTTTRSLSDSSHTEAGEANSKIDIPVCTVLLQKKSEQNMNICHMSHKQNMGRQRKTGTKIRMRSNTGVQRQVHCFHLEIRTSNLFTSAPSSLWTYNYLTRIQTYHLHEKLKAPPFLSKIYQNSSFLIPSNNPQNYVTGIPENNLESTKSEFNLQGPCSTNKVHAKALKY